MSVDQASRPAPPIKQQPLHGPWPATSPWARHWPGPARPATPATVVAVALAALVAALSLPGRPGIGWLVTALAGGAAVLVAGSVPASGGPAPLVVRPVRRASRWERRCWGAATVALFAVGTFRAAGWLFVLCLVVATLTGTLALAGGRSMRSILAAYTMPPAAALRAPRWLADGVTRLHRPGGTSGARVVATTAVSVALLAAFGALFVSADLYFASALETVVPTFDVGTTLRWLAVAAVTGMLVGGAAFLRAARPDLTGLDGTEGRKVRRWEWAVPLSLLVLLFGAFVAVQAVVLVRGDRLVQAYAGSAREGFWQLSFVTGLTLVVLAGAARWAPRRERADRLLIRLVLGALTALTLVIAATALHRMSLYTAEYGLTRLRLLVFCCELWFVLVLGLVLLAGARIRAPWLPRVAIAAGVLALLGLAAADPDAMIAERNVQHRDRPVDVLYLGRLSPDAAPALTKLPPGQRDCALGAMSVRLDRSGDWRSWNLGRERGRRLIDEQLGDRPWRCW